MSERPDQSLAQTMADAIVDSAILLETGRISSLARQGLEEPASLTSMQARHVFGAFLLLVDPLIRLRDEKAPPPLIAVAARLPPASSPPALRTGSPAQREGTFTLDLR